MKKTETMAIIKGSLNPACEINVGPSSLKQEDKFKYIGKIITGDGRCEQEIESRNAQSKQTLNKFKNILTNKHPSFQIRERVLQCYVYSILTYGCETWALSKAVEKRIQATEMCFFQECKRFHGQPNAPMRVY